jgi:hypothetical protein
VSNRWVLGAGVAGWTIIAIVTWLAAVPLGHDESQYVIAGADLLAGRETRWLYLSQGTTALAVPGILAGGSDLALRVLPAVLGFGFLATAYFLARTVGAAPPWIVAVLAASFGIVKRSTDLLSDMPAAAALLAGTALLLELLRDDGPRRRIVLAGACFAAAVYLRYGSALPIAIIGAVAAIGGWRGIRRRPGLVAATLGVFVVVLAPHMLFAYAKTGSPLGIITFSTDMIQTVSEPGLVTYLTSPPLRWYGIVTTPLLVLGLVSIIWLRERRFVMLWVIAVACVIGLGLTALAQARYIYFSQVLLLVLGIELVRRFVTRRLAYACAAIVVASWAMALLWAYRDARRPTPAHFVVKASRAMHPPCKVLGTMVQLLWYSPCEPVHDVYLEAVQPGKPPHYVVITPAQFPLDRQAIPGKQTVLLEERGMTLLRVDP